jgi:hypothetical protein
MGIDFEMFVVVMGLHSGGKPIETKPVEGVTILASKNFSSLWDQSLDSGNATL